MNNITLTTRQRGKAAIRQRRKNINNQVGLPSLIERVINFLMLVELRAHELNILGAFLTLIEEGLELFLLLVINNKYLNYSRDDANLKYEKLKNSLNYETIHPSINHVLWIANNHGFQNFNFYSPPDLKGNINFSLSLFYFEFIPSLGVFEHENQLAVINSNIIKFINTKQLKNLVIEKINKSDIVKEHKALLRDYILKRNREIYSKGQLDYIKEVEVERMKSTKNVGYLFFDNCWLEITKLSVTQREIGALPRPIFEKHIIPGNFYKCNNFKDFNFYNFLINVTSDWKDCSWKPNNERLESLLSALGYLIHSYKDRLCEKAIIFMDDNTENEDQANGRRGKGILTNAVDKMVNMCHISGKKLNSGGNFDYQKLTTFTQVLAFDDLPQQFNFENYFNIVTDNWEIEKKFKDAFDIIFEDSPKVLMTTNYAIKSRGASTVGRIFEIPLSSYYNATFTPGIDFGETFLDENTWDDDNWNKFHNLMVSCLQLYLKKGLIPVKGQEFRREMLSFTNRDFLDFCNKLVPNQRYDKRKEYDDFQARFPNSSDITPIRFKKFLDAFAKAKDYQAKHTESNSKSYVEFKEKSKCVSQRVPATSPLLSVEERLIDQVLEN